MNYSSILKSELFSDMVESDIKKMLSCLGSTVKTYDKGEIIYHAGDYTEIMGLVLSGGVNIEQNDIWGRQSILGYIEPGELFGETYSCVPAEPLMVDVVTVKPSEIMFLNAGKVMTTCSSSCSFHHKLVRNLLTAVASKNLTLSRKISTISPRSIRERLLTYLSFQAIQKGTHSFDIPFDRQQLADYLCTDRSALSKELSKMQADGLLTYKKNKFHLMTPP